jgi:hypothetical protein
MSEGDPVRDLRREEAFTLFTTARSHMARSDQLLTIGGAFLAAVTAVAVKDGHEEIMLGVAPALLLLLSVSLQVFADVTLMTAARQRLEEVLAKELRGEQALIIETLALKYRTGRYIRGGFALQVAFIVFTAGAAVEGLHVACGLGRTAVILYLGATAMALAAALLSARDLFAVREDATKRLRSWPEARLKAPEPEIHPLSKVLRGGRVRRLASFIRRARR